MYDAALIWINYSVAKFATDPAPLKSTLTQALVQAARMELRTHFLHVILLHPSPERYLSVFWCRRVASGQPVLFWSPLPSQFEAATHVS